MNEVAVDRAGVAKHGQRRSPEAAVPQGFVGSNPTPRTISEHPAVSEILTRYLNYLLCKKSLKPATIKRKVKTIKSLLKHGVELPNPDNVMRARERNGKIETKKGIVYRFRCHYCGASKGIRVLPNE
jgi:hypothetical protein